jgi:hypothetical protein
MFKRLELERTQASTDASMLEIRIMTSRAVTAKAKLATLPVTVRSKQSRWAVDSEIM